VLSRGQTQRSLPNKVQLVQADRHGDLNALKDERFDVVFDTCGYTPDVVEDLLNVVGSHLQRYVFISSTSVYGDYSKLHICETDPAPSAAPTDLEVARNVAPEDRSSAFAYGKSYGPLKRACEIVAQHHLDDRAIILRSGLLVGAGDYTDRLTWWVRRIDQGGRVPIPARKDSPFQMIDVRDAAAFAVRTVVEGCSGIYNLTGPEMPLSALFESAAGASGADVDLVWVAEEKVEEIGVEPWTELPIILPVRQSLRHFFQIGTRKAQSAGLLCRPSAETLVDILNWDRADRERLLKCGISQEQEAALLA
jgi:2'-hydroxyisoflavone reductase